MLSRSSRFQAMPLRKAAWYEPVRSNRPARHPAADARHAEQREHQDRPGARATCLGGGGSARGQMIAYDGARCRPGTGRTTPRRRRARRASRTAGTAAVPCPAAASRAEEQTCASRRCDRRSLRRRAVADDAAGEHQRQHPARIRAIAMAKIAAVGDDVDLQHRHPRRSRATPAMVRAASAPRASTGRKAAPRAPARPPRPRLRSRPAPAAAPRMKTAERRHREPPRRRPGRRGSGASRPWRRSAGRSAARSRRRRSCRSRRSRRRCRAGARARARCRRQAGAKLAGPADQAEQQAMDDGEESECSPAIGRRRRSRCRARRHRSTSDHDDAAMSSEQAP